MGRSSRAWCALGALVAASCVGPGACRRAAAPSAAAGVDAGGERISLPSGLFAGHEGLREIPLGWVYLPEDPVPTGTVARAYFGAVLPCGYEPALAGSAREGEDRVWLRLRARPSPGPAAPCTEGGVPFVEAVSLQRVRLGRVSLFDATERNGADAGLAPLAVLRVVAEDAAPPAHERRLRACDAHGSCPAGGVCVSLATAGATAGRSSAAPDAAFCVPALALPRAVVGERCAAEERWVRVRPREGTNPRSPAPSDANWGACLPRCGAEGRCAEGFRCTASAPGPSSDAAASAGEVCVPMAPAALPATRGEG